jgi:hypothetical protein
VAAGLLMGLRMPRSSERGAILLQVAIGLLVLTAFAGFAIDQGVMWVGRQHDQNVADAGALAGAISRAFDEPNVTPAVGGTTEQSIQGIAGQFSNFGGSTRGLTWSWTCPPTAVGGVAGPGCVRVEVYNDGTHGSSRLPVFFMAAVGVADQGTRATATAQAAVANGTDCLRPFGVPDKWFERNSPPSPTTFDRYVTSGKNAGTLITSPDVYQAPTASDPGSGYTIANDYGTQFTLKYGNGNSGQSPGWYQPLDVPRADGEPDTGGQRYRDNISNCNGADTGLGDFVPTETGAMMGPTNQGIGNLIAQDPNAHWDGTKVAQSCVTDNSCPGGYTGAISPRVITLAVYDVDAFQYGQATNNWSACPTGGSCVKIVNFLGFFVDHMSGNDVIGYLVRVPGKIIKNKPSLTGSAAFNISITLIS